MTETVTHGYSSESTQGELSNEYQHDRVLMVFKILCVLVYWTKVASALGGSILKGATLWAYYVEVSDALNPLRENCPINEMTEGLERVLLARINDV